MQYKTTTVVLTNNIKGFGEKNLSRLDDAMNNMAAEGWTLITMTNSFAGDKTVFTLVFGK